MKIRKSLKILSCLLPVFEGSKVNSPAAAFWRLFSSTSSITMNLSCWISAFPWLQLFYCRAIGYLMKLILKSIWHGHDFKDFFYPTSYHIWFATYSHVQYLYIYATLFLSGPKKYLDIQGSVIWAFLFIRLSVFVFPVYFVLFV